SVWSAGLQILHANLASISLLSTRLTGGDYGQGIVTLDGEAPPGGAAITLASDQAAALPGTPITIPAGGNQAAFLIRSAAVAKPVTAQITASYRGASQSAALQIDPPYVIHLQVSPRLLTGGAPATGTVWIS